MVAVREQTYPQRYNQQSTHLQMGDLKRRLPSLQTMERTQVVYNSQGQDLEGQRSPPVSQGQLRQDQDRPHELYRRQPQPAVVKGKQHHDCDKHQKMRLQEHLKHEQLDQDQRYLAKLSPCKIQQEALSSEVLTLHLSLTLLRDGKRCHPTGKALPPFGSIGSNKTRTTSVETP